VVGANFTLGHRGSGTTETLTQLCERPDINADVVGLLHHVDATCSSTSIRTAVRRGNVRRATAALGRPHWIDTVTTRDNGVHEIHTAAGAAVPGPGRYYAQIDGSVPGVVHIDSHGHIQICHPSVTTGLASIEFIDRLDLRQGRSARNGTTSIPA
jgi:riboflavin kinase / FMN adenylyltransferase